jgi:aspartate ammonia-lyase
LADKCVKGILANRQTCAANVEKSLAMATYLVPHIGYDKAAVIAKKAHETGKTIAEIVREEKILSEKELVRIFFS